MKQVLCIADSFKGTLSSETVNEVIAGIGRKYFPQTEFRALPIADGGEGSVASLLKAASGEAIAAEVTGPLFEPVEAVFGLLADGRTAVIEMASCAGLPLVGPRKNPERTTTFGVGELIRAAVMRGASHILLGLGGSCTHDGGCGMASALGVEFRDAQGKSFVPVGGSLGQIAHISTSHSLLRQHPIRITAMCDVKNPACGNLGAAHVYAPQKGADSGMVARLEQGTGHLCDIILRDLGCDVRNEPGAGAAGAMGAGVLAFTGGELRSGIDAILDAVAFDRLLEDCTLVITGEGKIDRQSVQGKAIDGIARRARRAGVPVVVLAGSADAGAEDAYAAGVEAILTCCRMPQPLSGDEASNRANLAFAADNLFRLLRLGSALHPRLRGGRSSVVR